MKFRESRTLDYIILSIALVNVSAASILVRLASVHGFVAASWRLIIGSILTLALLLLFRRGTPLQKPTPKEVFYMVISGVSLALHFGLWMWSLQHLNVGPSVTIVDGYPALLAVIGTIFFGERYTMKEYTGIGLTFSGVALLSIESFREGVAPPGGDPILGSILSFLGMIAVAIYFAIGKYIRMNIDTMTYTGYVYTTAALTSLVMVYIIGEPMTGYPLESYFYLLLLGTVPMLGGHTLLNYLLKRMKLAAVTAPVITEPIVSSILAYILFKEYLSPYIIVYMGITILGITLVLGGRED